MLKYTFIFMVLFITACETKDKYDFDNKTTYYLTLEKQCEGSSCCRSALKVMADNNYTLAPKNKQCPKGFFINMKKCIDSYAWCHKNKDERN